MDGLPTQNELPTGGATCNADGIFRQMRNEPHPVPRFIVMSAGTGGTSATIGRYIRCRGAMILNVVVDRKIPSFYLTWQDRDASLRSPAGGKVKNWSSAVEPSFIPDVVDECCACRTPPALPPHAGWKRSWAVKSAPLPANMWGALQLAADARRLEETGAIVTLLCDSGDKLSGYLLPSVWVGDHIGDLCRGRQPSQITYRRLKTKKPD